MHHDVVRELTRPVLPAGHDQCTDPVPGKRFRARNRRREVLIRHRGRVFGVGAVDQQAERAGQPTGLGHRHPAAPEVAIRDDDQRCVEFSGQQVDPTAELVEAGVAERPRETASGDQVCAGFIGVRQFLGPHPASLALRPERARTILSFDTTS
ncbi:hypothetical protein FNH05_27410 [Amycolatopsis rhizosphaerae]|uniref:Uncharacterized protein n=1 Tax=Amycolatopsis rhizosphaerae TaxID=2053003 RepID=A0A558B924_9PSEU|nr:hypothetical protein FNH05_27410 [Amycolatopsis rhizosphaerae]